MCGEGWAPVCTLIPSSPPFQGPPCRLILLSSSTSFHLLGDSTGSEQGGFPGGRGPQACLHTRGPLKRPEPGGPARGGGETPPMWSYIRAPCPSLSLHFRLRSRSPVCPWHTCVLSVNTCPLWASCPPLHCHPQSWLGAAPSLAGKADQFSSKDQNPCSVDSGPTGSREVTQASLPGHGSISRSYSLDSLPPCECTALNQPRKRSRISLGLCDLMPQNADCLLSLALKPPRARPPEHECAS